MKDFLEVDVQNPKKLHEFYNFIFTRKNEN